MMFFSVKRKQLIHLILRLDFEQEMDLEYLQPNSSLHWCLPEQFFEKDVWICSFLVTF